MKLILAIIHNDDAPIVTTQLSNIGIQTTKIASTGGFLSSGNTTFISGVEDSRTQEVIEVISKHCKKRTQQHFINNCSMGDGAIGSLVTTEVTVGGATIFVLNIEKCQQV